MTQFIKIPVLMGVLLLLAACVNNPPQPRPRHISISPSELAKPTYRVDAPARYVVQRGDTLWGIAGRFLQSPARWREVWYANPQIKQPNLIYLGDVIGFVSINGQRKLHIVSSRKPNRQYAGKTADGRPIYRLSPNAQPAVDEPIPTLSREVIRPFISKNRMIETEVLSNYPYLVAQENGDYLSLSGQAVVFAKGEQFNSSMYDVFRLSKAVVDPENNQVLGSEAVYVGQLQLIAPPNADGVATLRPTDNVNAMMPQDVLIPATAVKADLFFQPQLPPNHLAPTIIKPIGDYASRAASQFDSIMINRGRSAGVTEGMVFGIVRGKLSKAVGRSGEVLNLPNRVLGHAIVYKTYGQVSYALIVEATDVIYAGDWLVKP